MSPALLLRDLDNYRGYLVRLRRAGPGAPWCAYAMNVQTREEYEFATLEELFCFLTNETHPLPAAQTAHCLQHAVQQDR